MNVFNCIKKPLRLMPLRKFLAEYKENMKLETTSFTGIPK